MAEDLRSRQLEFAHELLDKAYPRRISVAAIVGNATEENQCLPRTYGPKDHNSDGALQWRLGRLDELKTWTNWDTLLVQARFAAYECKRDFPELHAQLLNPGARTLENLTANFMEVFERPAPETNRLDLRIKYAHDVLNLLNEHVPVAAAPTQEVQTMPISAIIQIAVQLAPAIEAIVSGIAGGVAKAHGASGVPSTSTPTAPVPQFDFASFAKQLADELGKLQAPK